MGQLMENPSQEFTYHNADIKVYRSDSTVHVILNSICNCGTHCEPLGVEMPAGPARELALALLDSANLINPVS